MDFSTIGSSQQLTEHLKIKQIDACKAREGYKKDFKALPACNFHALECLIQMAGKINYDRFKRTRTFSGKVHIWPAEMLQGNSVKFRWWCSSVALCNIKEQTQSTWTVASSQQ